MHRTYLILGGAGLVGTQVCRQIALRLEPTRIFVASLLQAEARQACERLSAEFPELPFEPVWGNLFVPSDMAELGRGGTQVDGRRGLADTTLLVGDGDDSRAFGGSISSRRVDGGLGLLRRSGRRKRGRFDWRQRTTFHQSERTSRQVPPPTHMRGVVARDVSRETVTGRSDGSGYQYAKTASGQANRFRARAE